MDRLVLLYPKDYNSMTFITSIKAQYGNKGISLFLYNQQSTNLIRKAGKLLGLPT